MSDAKDELIPGMRGNERMRDAFAAAGINQDALNPLVMVGETGDVEEGTHTLVVYVNGLLGAWVFTMRGDRIDSDGTEYGDAVAAGRDVLLWDTALRLYFDCSDDYDPPSPALCARVKALAEHIGPCPLLDLLREYGATGNR